MKVIKPGAAIFIGRARSNVQEQLVDRALRAAALDLADRLRVAGLDAPLIAGPDLEWLADEGVQREPDEEPFHFGARLAQIVTRYSYSPLLYFGAGSAPLLRAETLAATLAALLEAERAGQRLVVTNNLHSCDWLGLTRAAEAVRLIARAHRDNGLAWSLQEDAGYRVEIALPPDSPAQLDLDTPADLALVREHPDCSPGLRAALDDPLLDRLAARQLLDLLGTDGSRIALIGRVSPAAWHALSRGTRCWIRAFSEERGMTASERVTRGEVRSLIGVLLRELGPEQFFAELAMMADGAIIDTRVLMASRGPLPDTATRFASDLLRPDWIADPWLRDFTAAAQNAPLPVLLGGHSVVAGGLFALAEVVRARREGSQGYQ